MSRSGTVLAWLADQWSSGVYLTDLTFIEDGIPSTIKKTNLINFAKRAKTAEIIRDIQQCQNEPYPLQPVPELQDYILTNMQSAGDVHEMYERSLAVEPRENQDEKIARYGFQNAGWTALTLVSGGSGTPFSDRNGAYKTVRLTRGDEADYFPSRGSYDTQDCRLQSSTHDEFPCYNDTGVTRRRRIDGFRTMTTGYLPRDLMKSCPSTTTWTFYLLSFLLLHIYFLPSGHCCLWP